MSNWNSPPYPQNPNQGYYPNQPYPQQSYPQQPYQPYPGATQPQAGYSPGPAYDYGQPAAQPDFGQFDDEVKGFDFSDSSIRRGFIRKVYAILMVQLLITAAFISGFYFSEGAQNFVAKNPWLFIMAIVVYFAAMIALACCGEVRRKAPMNYILLILFTVAQSFMLAIATTRFDVESILMAVGITAALCLGLTLFAFQTKWDFTVCGGFLFICVLVLMLFGLIISIFAISGAYSTARTLNLVYACIGAVLFSLYLVYDTQLMMGGKHKYSISPEEYIFAALNLYLDVVNIFLFILTIIGAAKN